ncbi:hypothetical protein [Aliivibrio sp. SR45-2]|uniref:hypothetical protein n=1 Tax=Aliivibrio sp. SR45-2 TaxID=2760931 RepID=UPI0021052F88|nr:hypothetical protein [Aliivibrio sp. SR45-2]
MFFSYSKSEEIKAIQKGILQLFIQCIFATVAYLVVRTDIVTLHNGLSEHSLTEYYQQLLLLIVILSFSYIATTNSEVRSFAILIIGFFTCILIRECDGDNHP